MQRQCKPRAETSFIAYAQARPVPHIYRKGTNKDRKSLELIDIYCPIHRITNQKSSLWDTQKKKVNLQKRHKKRVL